MAASAAGIALGWKGRGWFFHASRPCSPYAAITCLSVGSTRLQKGHWKSDHSTMVTAALAAPRRRVARLRLELRLRRRAAGGLRIRRLHVVHQRLVELVVLDALLAAFVGLLDLFVDHRLEGLEGHGAGDELAVEEERGRAVGADLRGIAAVLLMLRPPPRTPCRPSTSPCRGQPAAPTPRTSPPRARSGGRTSGRASSRTCRCPALRRHRRLGRRQGVGVEAERLVAPDDAHVVLVGLEDALQRRLHACRRRGTGSPTTRRWSPWVLAADGGTVAGIARVCARWAAARRGEAAPRPVVPSLIRYS